jgi:hypothetical protein
VTLSTPCCWGERRSGKMTVLLAHVFRAAMAGCLLAGPAGAFVAVAPATSPLAVESQPEATLVLTVGNNDPSAPNAPVAPQTGNPLWATTLDQLAITRERPIFSPSRRPPPVVAEPPRAELPPSHPSAPPEPERPQLSLVGTVASAREGIGIFVEQTTKNVVRLRMGEAHQGWILRAVQGREATLERNNELAVLAVPPPGSGERNDGLPPAAIKRAPAAEQTASVRPPASTNRTGAARQPESRIKSR